ncbi:hypothetical protein DFH28DRAFT_929170 [Melampsora americana]|nr:hypothetical protein DFH28DRAFT_929170 [Melampsora americana]
MARPNPGSVVISAFFNVPDVTRRHNGTNQRPSARATIMTSRKGMRPLETLIELLPEENAEQELFSPGLCFLSGRFLAYNEQIKSTLYYTGMESRHLIHVSSIHPRFFINSINLESHGLFVCADHDAETSTTKVTLLHTDYDPTISLFQDFKIEYLCTPDNIQSGRLQGLSLGCPLCMSGKIVGRNEVRHMWIVLVHDMTIDSTYIQ